MTNPINNPGNPRDCPDCGLSARGGAHYCPKPESPNKLTVDECELYKAIAYADRKNEGKLGRITAIRDEVLLFLNRYEIQHKEPENGG